MSEENTKIESYQRLLVRAITAFALGLAALLSVTASIPLALVVATFALAVLGAGRLTRRPEGGDRAVWLALGEFICWLVGVFVVIIVGQVWLAIPLLVAFGSEAYWRQRDRPRTAWNSARAVTAVVFAIVELVLASFVSVAVALGVGVVVQMVRTHRATTRHGRPGSWIVLTNKFAFMMIAFVAVQAALLRDASEAVDRFECAVEDVKRSGEALRRAGEDLANFDGALSVTTTVPSTTTTECPPGDSAPKGIGEGPAVGVLLAGPDRCNPLAARASAGLHPLPFGPCPVLPATSCSSGTASRCGTPRAAGRGRPTPRSPSWGRSRRATRRRGCTVPASRTWSRPICNGPGARPRSWPRPSGWMSASSRACGRSTWATGRG